MHAPDWVFKPSRCYLVFLLLLLLGSFIILLALPLMISLKCLLILSFCGYSLYLYQKTYLLRGGQTIKAIKALPDGQWEVSTPTRVYRADLLGQSTVTAYVAVLRFKIKERHFPLSCVIFPDSLAPGAYRELLFTLRAMINSP